MNDGENSTRTADEIAASEPVVRMLLEGVDRLVKAANRVHGYKVVAALKENPDKTHVVEMAPNDPEYWDTEAARLRNELAERLADSVFGTSRVLNHLPPTEDCTVVCAAKYAVGDGTHGFLFRIMETTRVLSLRSPVFDRYHVGETYRLTISSPPPDTDDTN